MTIYRCFIRGENFPVIEDGGRKLLGFFAIRFVEAENAEMAETVGLGHLRNEDWLKSLKANIQPDDPPAIVHFDEIDQAMNGEKAGSVTGFTFFEMEQARK